MNIRDVLTDKLTDSTIKLYGFFIIIGFVLFGVTFIGMLFNNREVFEYSFTLAISLLALGFACFSVKIGRDSDKKMIAITNSQFIEIYEELQNITLREILPSITEDSQEANNLRGAYVWKYNQSLERAILLKEWADESQRTNLVLPFDTLLKRIPWDKQMFENKDVRDLLDGYLLIKELDIPNNILENIEELIEKTIIERKKEKSIIECIERTKSVLDKNPNMKFKSPYLKG